MRAPADRARFRLRLSPPTCYLGRLILTIIPRKRKAVHLRRIFAKAF